MTEEFKNKILESIKKGGFATELKASKILNNRDWLVLNNYIYYDKEKSISREIDLLCIMGSHHNNSLKLDLKISLIIEVKKSEKPWVFFISQNEPSVLEHSFFSLTTYKNINHVIFDKLFDGYPRQKIEYLSTSHTEAFRDNEISNIHKAIESAVKATHYFHNTDELEKNKPKPVDDFDNGLFDPIDQNRQSRLHMFIPVVVFDGLLLEARLDNNSDLQIQEGKYVPYQSYYIDDNGLEHSYAVDIIKLEYLNEYLHNLEFWIDKKGKDILKFRTS